MLSFSNQACETWTVLHQLCFLGQQDGLTDSEMLPPWIGFALLSLAFYQPTIQWLLISQDSGYLKTLEKRISRVHKHNSSRSYSIINNFPIKEQRLTEECEKSGKDSEIRCINYFIRNIKFLYNWSFWVLTGRKMRSTSCLGYFKSNFVILTQMTCHTLPILLSQPNLKNSKFFKIYR